MQTMDFVADRKSIRGPKSTDNSYVVSFEVGEYMKDKIAELILLPDGCNFKITVEAITSGND